MKKSLPKIVESAKMRPLGYASNGDFVYYDGLQNGSQKLVPTEQLSEEQLLKLSIERHLTDVTGSVATLNGDNYSNTQRAKEIQDQTKIGKQLFESDIDYLKFYLEQFPEDCFEK